MQNINNSFSQTLNFFKDNLTLIIIGIYSISFINYYLFYSSFNINIFSYLSIDDLLFFTLEHFFKVFTVSLLVECILFLIFTWLFGIWQNYVILKRKGLLYINSTKPNRERLRDVFDKKFSSSYRDFRIGIAFILCFVIVFIPNKLILIPALTIYFFYSLGMYVENEKFTSVILIFAVSIVFIFTIIGTLYNIHSKRFKKDDFEISFYDNNKLISTEKKLMTYNYLGETSTHIFIYDLKNKCSRIIFKESINDYTIKSSNDIDKIVAKVGEFVEYVATDKTTNNIKK